MYVECFTNNAKPYLRLVQSVRVTNKAGKKIPQKQVVLNLGPLDRFDDGQPDYVDRLKKSFKSGPLLSLPSSLIVMKKRIRKPIASHSTKAAPIVSVIRSCFLISLWNESLRNWDLILFFILQRVHQTSVRCLWLCQASHFRAPLTSCVKIRNRPTKRRLSRANPC